MTLTVVSLFDGIGGFPLAFERAGARTVATVEIDKAAAAVSERHFPHAHQFDDVTKVTGDDLLAAGFIPDRGVITAGWPCQDLSVAGKREGLEEGERSSLFFHVIRLALELQPRWLVLENVPGLLSSEGPDDEHRCVCGWPYRRGGLYLCSGHCEERPEGLFAGGRNRHVREGAAGSEGDATPLSRVDFAAPGSYRKVVCGLPLESERSQSGGMSAPIATSLDLEVRAGTSCDSDGRHSVCSDPAGCNVCALDRRGRGSMRGDSQADSGTECQGSRKSCDCGDGEDLRPTDCPSCGRPVGDRSSGSAVGSGMGTVLRSLVNIGFRVSWRVLDAQHFGVPQRRRRVFFVGHLGEPWPASAEVLFECESSAGDSAAGGETGQGAAGAVAGGVGVPSRIGGGASAHR